jgi:hypothetical protein
MVVAVRRDSLNGAKLVSVAAVNTRDSLNGAKLKGVAAAGNARDSHNGARLMGVAARRDASAQAASAALAASRCSSAARSSCATRSRSSPTADAGMGSSWRWLWHGRGRAAHSKRKARRDLWFVERFPRYLHVLLPSNAAVRSPTPAGGRAAPEALRHAARLSASAELAQIRDEQECITSMQTAQEDSHVALLAQIESLKPACPAPPKQTTRSPAPASPTMHPTAPALVAPPLAAWLFGAASRNGTAAATPRASPRAAALGVALVNPRRCPRRRLRSARRRGSLR